MTSPRDTGSELKITIFLTNPIVEFHFSGSFQDLHPLTLTHFPVVSAVDPQQYQLKKDEK